MEPKFNTSFIPKQSLARAEKPAAGTPTHSGGGIITVIALVMLIIVGGIATVIFIYERFLNQSVDAKLDSLERARGAFQPALLQKMERVDTRLTSAQQLLSEHVAPSALFSILESLTLKSVRYSSFSYEWSSPTTIEISMAGVALNLEAVALQSDVLGNNQFIRQPIVSGIAVQGEGAVIFDVAATVDPRFLKYESLLRANETEGDQAQQNQQNQQQ